MEVLKRMKNFSKIMIFMNRIHDIICIFQLLMIKHADTANNCSIVSISEISQISKDGETMRNLKDRKHMEHPRKKHVVIWEQRIVLIQ